MIGVGTNMYVKTNNIFVSHTDSNGDADVVRCSTANIPSSASGFSVGCKLTDTTTGLLYYNSGTTTSCTFTAVNTDTAGNIALNAGKIIVGNDSNVGAAQTQRAIAEATANGTTPVNVLGTTNGYAGTITGAFAVTSGTVSTTITLKNGSSTVGTIATSTTLGDMTGMTSLSNTSFLTAGTMTIVSNNASDTAKVFVTFTTP